MSYWLASVTEQSNWSNALTFLPRTNCYHHYLVLIPSQIHCSSRLSLKPTETIPPSSNVIHRHLSTILSVTLFSFPPMLSSQNNMKFAPFQTSQTSQTATQPPFGWRHCYRSTFSTVVFLQRYPYFLNYAEHISASKLFLLPGLLFQCIHPSFIPSLQPLIGCHHLQETFPE